MIGREGGTIVGFLDVLKGVKETYDRKIEEERKRSAEIVAQREEFERQLQGTEMIQCIVSHLMEIPGLGESQGSLDSNCRQVIVTEETVTVNNYPDNTFVDSLKWVKVHNNEVEYGIAQQQESYMEHRMSVKMGIVSKSNLMNEYVNQTLSDLRESSDFYCTTLSFDMLGFEDIERNILKSFTNALKNALKEKCQVVTTDVRWNGRCAYVFEMLVSPKKKKSIF